MPERIVYLAEKGTDISVIIANYKRAGWDLVDVGRYRPPTVKEPYMALYFQKDRVGNEQRTKP